MRQSKIDRSAYSKENADPFVKQSEICRSQGDPVEISHRWVLVGTNVKNYLKASGSK